MSVDIDLDRFVQEYRKSTRDVLRFLTPDRQRVIARHNVGLEPGRTDLAVYLAASETRFVRAARLFNEHLRKSDVQPKALDVGGFLGAYPLTLARLGIPTALAEVYEYYDGALDDLSRFLASDGVEILDVDFTQPLDEHFEGSFGMVTNMAMLEHISGSPSTLMKNLLSVTANGGALVLEVPNIAYWPNRLTLLRGRSIHPPLDEVLGSAPPFLGHHREYTVSEVRELLRVAGFNPLTVEQFNYSIPAAVGSRVDRIYSMTVQLLPTLVLRNCRELIMALATPQ